jgi:hypothetical protein
MSGWSEVEAVRREGVAAFGLKLHDQDKLVIPYFS